MSWYTTLQPNGNLAIYSDIVDNWIALDLTLDEVVAMIDPAPDQLERIKAAARGELPGIGYHTWHDAMVTAILVNGIENEPIRAALALTHEDMREKILREVAEYQEQERLEEST